MWKQTKASKATMKRPLKIIIGNARGIYCMQAQKESEYSNG